MGLNTNTVLTIMRTDTSNAEAAVKRLRGVERERAKAMLDDLNDQNSRLEKQIATFGRITVAVGAVVGFYKLAQNAAKAYLEDVRLESAAAGANLDRLKTATEGLVEADTLLAFAGKAQAGVWKLNQREMETVLRGANALRIQTGRELTPTIEALNEAITKGTTRSLKGLGIEVKDKAGLLKVLEERFESLGGKTRLTGDDFVEANIKMADAVDDLKGEFGKLAIQLTPVVVEMANMVGVTKRLVEAYGQLPGALRGVFNDDLDKTLKTMLGVGNLWLKLAEEKVDLLPPPMQQPMGPPAPNAGPGTWTLPWKLTPEERMRMIQAPRGPDPFQKIGAEGLKPSTPVDVPAKLKVSTVEVDAQALADELATIYGAAKAVVMAVPGAAVELARQARFGGDLRDELDASREFLKGFHDEMRALKQNVDITTESLAKQAQMAELARGQTMLSKIFGTPAEIDLTTVALQGAAGAFNVLAQAAGAGMDAWITGEKSFADAIKSAVAEGLRALAVQATVEALKNTAFGAAALAFGPIMGPTAAQHFAAAGLWAGVAVAAGAGAKAMGAGGGAPTAAAGSAAGSALSPRVGGGASGEEGPRQTVVMLGRDFMGLTDLEQRQLIYQAIQQGKVLDVRSGTISRS